MRSQLKVKALLVLAALVLSAGAQNVLAATPPAAGPTVMTVTAVGKKDTAPPEIKRDDIQLYQAKERIQIADWRRSDQLFLTLLIDDTLEQNVASQWNDAKAFINEQPPTTMIAVAYARNGSAQIAQDFTADHELAAKALRIPLGNGGAFSSPYLSLQDLIKRLPGEGQRRSIIFFTSGIDYLRGNFGPTSPDLDPTIERAQKANINIWTIYALDAGHGARGFFRVNNAQSNLSQLSDETGAESYYLGFGMAVSFKPYFDEITTHLRNQYLLSFVTGGGKKGRFERVHLGTEMQNLEFMTPSEVFIPASQ